MGYRSRNASSKNPNYHLSGNEVAISKHVSPNQTHGASSHLQFTGGSIISPQPQYQPNQNFNMYQNYGIQQEQMYGNMNPNTGLTQQNSYQYLPQMNMQPMMQPSQSQAALGLPQFPNQNYGMMPMQGMIDMGTPTYKSNFRNMSVAQSVTALPSASNYDQGLTRTNPLSIPAIPPAVSESTPEIFSKPVPIKPKNGLDLSEYPTGGLPVQLLASKSVRTGKPVDKKGSTSLDFNRKSEDLNSAKSESNMNTQKTPQRRRQNSQDTSGPPNRLLQKRQTKEEITPRAQLTKSTSQQLKPKKVLYDSQKELADNRPAFMQQFNIKSERSQNSLTEFNQRVPSNYTPKTTASSPKAAFLKRKTIPVETALSHRTPRKVQYSPYTIDDYKKIKSAKVNRNGLGNGFVGTEAWKELKSKADRVKEFSQRVKERRHIPRPKKEHMNDEISFEI